MKLTRQDIENLANEIISFLEEYELDLDVHIFYNNKRIIVDSKWDEQNQCYVPIREVIENVSPLEYLEYFNRKHILSMSFDGPLFGAIYDYEEEFTAIFEKYDLFWELGDKWNLSVYPMDNDYDGIEYTSCEEKEFLDRKEEVT